MKNGWILFLILFCASSAQAFVQMTGMGYPSCVACHVSPNGGGLLTDYGRGVSNEYMSTWKAGDAFAKPLFGALKNTDRLKWGGDYRVIQVNLKNDNLDNGRLFVMQQNLELGYQWGNVTLVGTAGTLEAPQGTPGRGEFLSERHYALWSPSTQSRVRIGKFRQTYGLYLDNHERLIKSQFGFDSLSESYNMEYTQLFDNYEVVLGTNLGQMQNPNSSNSEKNVSAQFVHYGKGRSRLGANVLMGDSNQQRRFLSGINGVFSPFTSWTGIFELDYEQAHMASAPQVAVNSWGSLLKLGQTPVQGVMWYLLFEHYSRDSGTSYSLTHQPGLGVQWLPVSHFNIQLEYLRQVNNRDPGNPTHIAYALFHFYL